MGTTTGVPTRALVHMTRTTTAKTHTTLSLPDITLPPKITRGQSPPLHISKAQRTVHPLATPLSLRRQNPSGHRITLILAGATQMATITMIISATNTVGPPSLLGLHQHLRDHKPPLQTDHDLTRTLRGLIPPQYRRLTLKQHS